MTLRITIGLLALLAASAVLAADATITWTAPSQYTDGTPITKPITFSVYNASARIASGLTAPQYVVVNYASNPPCWTVTAVVDGVESARSAAACKSLTPKAPTGAVAK